MEISFTTFFVISLTINVSVLSCICLPPLVRLLLKRILRACDVERYEEEIQDNPAFFRRVYLDTMFNGAAMISGTALLCYSNVLSKPFLGFSQSLTIVFSVFVGWQLFKVFQTICDPDKTAKYSRINVVLRLVIVIHYLSTVLYRQSALLGVIGIVVEGHALFFKLDKLWRILKVDEKSKFYLMSSSITGISALVLRAIFPLIALLVTTINHWEEVLYMDYFPLTVFFLCLVFYTAANLWFLRMAFDPLLRCFFAKTKRPGDSLYTVNPEIPGFIHNNLWTGKGRSCALNINFNSPGPSFVHYSGTPQPMCMQNL